MTDAHAISAAPPSTATPEWLEQAGYYAIFGVAAAVQFSIAIAQSLLAIGALCWVALLIINRESVPVPRFFWPCPLFSHSRQIRPSRRARPI